jgi:hypothetical protein
MLASEVADPRAADAEAEQHGAIQHDEAAIAPKMSPIAVSRIALNAGSSGWAFVIASSIYG